MRRATLALVPWLGLAACGGLESPDLESGRVRGLLSNAASGAYVYPLGRPDLKVSVAPDGRYVVEQVPEETAMLVVVDGAAQDGTRRAQLLQVHVEGAKESEAPALDAAAMPLAGEVAAVVRLDGGCESSAPRFTVVDTDQVNVAPGAAGAAIMAPLPEGSFQLAASLGGFKNGAVPVNVVSAATITVEVPLQIDDGEAAHGCAAYGGACRNGLVCNPADGRCYECLSDAQCAGGTCEQHTCRSAGPGPMCAACTPGGTDCESGLFCVADGTGGGYCTRSCGTSYDCAGLACQNVAGIAPRVCVAPGGCSSYRSALGTPCFGNETCAAILVNGVCRRVPYDPEVPGYCTAQCTTSTSPDVCAAVQGYSCTGGMGVGYCTHP